MKTKDDRKLGDDLTETGIVGLNVNRDSYVRYSSLDALITDVDIDGIEAFWSDHEVFELGKKIAKPKVKVVWEGDDGY